MSQTIQQSEISAVIVNINRSFDVHLSPEDFKSANYSRSSLVDIVAQKIQDEKNGDWTADVAFHKLRSAIVNVKNINPSDITLESDLNTLFPSSARKKELAAIEEQLGFKMKILKPNSFLYGFFIFAFFAGIPLLSIGWFPAVITIVVSGIFIWLLPKTANQFKMKTVGHLADHLAWKNYLKDRSSAATFDKNDVMRKVEELLPR